MPVHRLIDAANRSLAADRLNDGLDTQVLGQKDKRECRFDIGRIVRPDFSWYAAWEKCRKLVPDALHSMTVTNTVMNKISTKLVNSGQSIRLLTGYADELFHGVLPGQRCL